MLASPPFPPSLPPASPSPIGWDAHGTTTDPFSIPFELSAHDGKLWISPEYLAPIPAAGSADKSRWQELRIKGTNWAGAQANGCPHQLWMYNVTQYIDFMLEHHFNAVRLPLSAHYVTHEYRHKDVFGICGRE